jgi:hypothetical protein
MGMFGQSQRSVFKPSVYQPGRRSRRVPRWLVLLMAGIVLGAGGVLFLQANYGPKRLTVEQSESLHSELSAANVDRQRLQSQLEEVTQQRDSARTGHEKMTSDLAQAQQKIVDQQKDLALFQQAVPADPHGGPIGIRAADWTIQPGQLGYKVLIMRDNAQGAPFEGTVQMVLQGRSSTGRVYPVAADPVPLTLDRYNQLAGQISIPPNYRPRTVSIKILDANKRQVAMRIFYTR